MADPPSKNETSRCKVVFLFLYSLLLKIVIETIVLSLLQGKLYDYYLPADVHNSQEEQEVAIWEDEEGPGSEDEKIAACSEDEETNEGKDIMNDSEETEDSSKWDKPDETAATNTDSNALTAEQDTGVHRRVVGAEGEGSEAGCEDGT